MSLTPELEQFVQKKGGERARYVRNRGDARGALQLLEKKDQREQEGQAALRDFQAEMDRRLAEADSGKVMDVEEASRVTASQSRC